MSIRVNFMKGLIMRHIVSCLLSVLCFLSLGTNEISATADHKEPNNINPKSIIYSLSTIAEKDMEKFSDCLMSCTHLMRFHNIPKVEARNPQKILNFISETMENPQALLSCEVCKINNQPLTLEEYLQFCINMQLKENYQRHFPLLQKERWLGIERILKYLRLNEEAQYSPVVRTLVSRISNDFSDPLNLQNLTLKDHWPDLKSNVSLYILNKRVDDSTYEVDCSVENIALLVFSLLPSTLICMYCL